MALRYVHWDQLSESLASLQGISQDDVILFLELKEESEHVKHHKKKLVFLFSAMRHFANTLCTKGYNVSYIELDDQHNTGQLEKEVIRCMQDTSQDELILTEASEYHVQQTFKRLEKKYPTQVLEDDRFLANHETFQTWAKGRKQLRMEYFYREMRKQYDVLMEEGKPCGGKWNYDAENRKPPKEGLDIPATSQFKEDAITKQVKQLVDQHFSQHFGDIEPFFFAVTREQALKVLSTFIKERLPLFGTYQDAMIEDEVWMYHAHISFYLNSGLLLPLECITAAEEQYTKGVALSAIEGFIRQILGWREFVRGIYWLKMPEYANENFLNATKPLPEFFWSGKTEMNCIKQVVSATKEHAYAHHIQRLMVIGNFALLAGLDPKDVNEWFWIVYCDAYQWVELPNVTGMALFADGGLLGSKPYCSSGAYINKMSNYCQGCRYNVKEKTGDDACPFNYLYWDFLTRNHGKLHSNQRLSFMYNMLEKMPREQISAIHHSAKRFLELF